MIIWSGLGFLAGIIPVLCYMGLAKLCEMQYGPEYINTHSWPGAMGTLIGAIAVYVLAGKLNTPTRTLVDTSTGETVIFKKKHSLFFIPMEYWSAILLVVAVWRLFFTHDSSL